MAPSCCMSAMNCMNLSSSGRGAGFLAASPVPPGRAAAELLPAAAASCRRAAGSGASPKPAPMGGAAFRAGIRPCPARCCPASRLTRTEAGTMEVRLRSLAAGSRGATVACPLMLAPLCSRDWAPSSPPAAAHAASLFDR